MNIPPDHTYTDVRKYPEWEIKCIPIYVWKNQDNDGQVVKIRELQCVYFMLRPYEIDFEYVGHGFMEGYSGDK